MNAKQLRQLSEPELADFCWRRFRLEPPLDPPLDTISRDEPPEAFIIEKLYSCANDGFRRRISGAMMLNLKRLAVENSQGQFDEASARQLASLGFLAGELKDSSLGHPLYAFALNWIFDDPEVGSPTEEALYHVLIAVASLQNGPGYAPLWLALWHDISSPRLKAVAVYGLSHADPKKALDLLPEILSTGGIDLPTMVWNLANEPLGSVELGLAAGKLSSSHQRKLRDALIFAGADAHTVANYDNGLRRASRLSAQAKLIHDENAIELVQTVRRFVFLVDSPISPEAARRPPYLEKLAL
jgi:hypothetical protein